MGLRLERGLPSSQSSWSNVSQNTDDMLPSRLPYGQLSRGLWLETALLFSRRHFACVASLLALALALKINLIIWSALGALHYPYVIVNLAGSDHTPSQMVIFRRECQVCEDL